MASQFKLFLNDQKQIQLHEYDYAQNSYTKILEDAYRKNLQQVIFTTSTYKNIIKAIYRSGLFLTEVQFMEPLDVYDSVDIKDLISHLNSSRGSDTLIKMLLKQIDWIVNDVGIDIKSITVLDRSKGLTSEIYSNGVILSDRTQIDCINSGILDPVISVQY